MTNIPDEITLRDLLEAAAFDLEQILKCVRSNGTPSMKYALESLPGLLGEQDFKDLCGSVGFADDMNVTGKDFAEAVRQHVLTSNRESDQRREKLRQAGLV